MLLRMTLLSKLWLAKLAEGQVVLSLASERVKLMYQKLFRSKLAAFNLDVKLSKLSQRA